MPPNLDWLDQVMQGTTPLVAMTRDTAGRRSTLTPPPQLVELEQSRAMLRQARRKKLLSDEHFAVDGTLIEAWAGQNSFQFKDDDDILNPSPPPDPGSNPTIDYRKQRRSNDTPQSKTDPLARLYKKGKSAEAKLAYLGHILAENRNGLVVNTRVTLATGTTERNAATQMAEEIPGASKRVTLGADRAYDTADFVEQIRELRVTPHVAQHDTNRRGAIDARTTNQPGYAISQRKRKRVEEVFGWMKTIALQRKTRFRGPDKVGWMFTLAAATYNLRRPESRSAGDAAPSGPPIRPLTPRADSAREPSRIVSGPFQGCFFSAPS